MNLHFDFSSEEFISKCVCFISRHNTTIYRDICDTLDYFISPYYCLNSGILDINHNIYKWAHLDMHLPLQMQMEQIHQTSYYRFDISTEKNCDINVENVILPPFLKIIPAIWDYGAIVSKLKCKGKNLKTKNKITIEFWDIHISNDVFLSVLEKFENIEYNFLLPANHQVWEWRQVFYNKVTGDTFFCSCFKNAIEKHLYCNGEDRKDRLLQNTLKSQSYKDNICHLCRGTPSNLSFCHSMYGSFFKVRYGAYIKKTAFEFDIDEREAENIVREQVGVPKIGERWINETMLYNYISVLFPNYEIHREASPDWLEGQRFDIYIPKLSLAIEYQGEQHFRAIELFGGKEGLLKTIKRDKIKADKCNKNQIHLVYFTYKDDLSEKLIEKRLNKFLT